MSSNTCIVILSPSVRGSFRNACADGFGADGYHLKANVPYIFCYVYGQNLTVADRETYYAGTLSHEIEETIVDPDPRGESPNPEVADPCWGNCNNLWRSFFDNNDNYIKSVEDIIPTDLAYSYYINAVVQPSWARISCPTTETIPDYACAYPPPTLEEACNGRLETIELLREEIQELEREIENETDDRIRQILIQQKRDKETAILFYRHEIEILGC